VSRPEASAAGSVQLGFERDAKPRLVALILGAVPNQQSGRGPKRIFGGYVATQRAIRTPVNLKLEIWSDEPMVPEDSSKPIVLRIGTSTLLELQLVPDSTGKGSGGTGGR
jgi:hypothetical protein